MTKINTAHRMLIITLLVLCIQHSSHGQNVSEKTIHWQINGAFDQKNQKEIPYSAVLITTKNQSIRLSQKNGAQTSHYQIDSTEGSWQDISLPGTIIYHTQKSGHSVKITIEKIETTTTMRMDFGNMESHLFRISSFHVLE